MKATPLMPRIIQERGVSERVSVRGDRHNWEQDCLDFKSQHDRKIIPTL